MSGTSVDGIDAVLASFAPMRVHACLTFPWPSELRREILALARADAPITLEAFGRLDARVGETLAEAARAVLAQACVAADEVRAIGSHGQTICHHPHGAFPYTLQIGDPTRIAERVGVDVVADFRRADVAAGGQGAPLVPIFHQALLADPGEERVVLNLGGIANVTRLAPGAEIAGFDTGPANALLDAWAERHLGARHDAGGAWAEAGKVDAELLARLLADPYFLRAPPKSSGREYFNLDWLAGFGVQALAPIDVQATLVELTARSVATALDRHAPASRRVIVCGGGVHNAVLMRALDRALAPRATSSSAALGVDPDYIEATAFAWLARQRLLEEAGNLPTVTGARGRRVLGAIHLAPRAD